MHKYNGLIVRQFLNYMKEAFLQYVWKNGLFDHKDMRTETGEMIEVIKLGTYNTDSGPDFLNAKIRIGDILWVGNVEIHIRSGDWFRHKHHIDCAYDNVILHVVDHFDKDVCNTNGEVLKVHKLRYSTTLFKEYEYIFRDRKFYSCFSEMRNEDSFSVNYWLQGLLIERLERKSNDVLRLYNYNHKSWEETLYQLVARYFGLNVNAEPFEQLARSLPLKYLARQRESSLQIEALLFGQSGLLDSLDSDTYQYTLIKEYEYLQKKYKLEPINASMWKFMRTRPHNFPTLRIAQFAGLVNTSHSLFSSVIEATYIEDLRKLFEVSASVYWDTHFSFNKYTKRKSKMMGKSTIDIIIINAIIPTIFAYARYNNNDELRLRALGFLESLNCERNYITKSVKKMGVKLHSAADSQALIQLKNEYCDKKRCLHCEIGNKLIRKTYDSISSI